MSTLNSIMSELGWQKRQRFRQRQRMVNRRQRKVNQISSTADFAQIEPSSLDVGSGVLHAALASLWRRKPLVGAIVATAVALGIIAVLVIPRSYTAVAYIRGGFAASDALAKDEDSSSASPMSVDLVRMIETQSRLLQSQDLARRVVRQLGLEQLRPEVSESQWLPDKFYGSAANHQEDQTDRAAARLLRHLSVTTDRDAYLIEVGYTSRDSGLAVVIANVFVAEFLRTSKLQMLYRQRSSAETALSRLLAKLGDKHPRVTAAKMRLAGTDDLLKEQLSEAPAVILQTAGENVTKAISAPSGPKRRFVIGLLLFVGLAVGIAVALWLERGRWAEPYFRHYARHFA